MNIFILNDLCGGVGSGVGDGGVGGGGVGGGGVGGGGVGGDGVGGGGVGGGGLGGLGGIILLPKFTIAALIELNESKHIAVHWLDISGLNG